MAPLVDYDLPSIGPYIAALDISTGPAHFSDRRTSSGQYISSFTGPYGPPICRGVDTCIISYMSLYFRHKYTRVLNNIMINIYIEEIFYHIPVL